MIRHVHISGQISERHDYFTTVIGPHVNIRLLYDGRSEPGKAYDRFFSGGSEIRVTERGISHTGTGGTFCPYMFGVDIPEKDLLRREVRNRLVMHGARYDELHDKLVFSADTSGEESFARIFNSGHAFANFFFFVVADTFRDMRSAQESVLRSVGKFLKRQDLNAAGRDGRDLALALYDEMGHMDWTLFVVKLIDVYAETYYRRYTMAYGATREIREDEQRTFDLLARHYALDPYQQERIHLDVIYEHGENKRLIDSYKDALTAHLENVLPEHAVMPKLNLLRAFALRNKIPVALFDRLDALLMNLRTSGYPFDPPFIGEARKTLAKLFVEHIGDDLEVQDLVQLLHAKRQSLEHRYVGFEAVLLEAARAQDDWARAGKSMLLRMEFEQIIDYLDLFDQASQLVNSIVFIDDFEIDPTRLEAMLECQAAFDEIRPMLFEELFITSLEQNKYLSRFARRRLEILKRGLRAAEKEPSGSRMIPESLRRINETARLHRILDNMLRAAVGNIHEEPLDDESKAALRTDVAERLNAEYGITSPIDDNLFETVLLGIEEEYFYSNQLLPTIIATRDLVLRENFLRSSGLDLFRIEALEAAYLRDMYPAAISAQDSESSGSMGNAAPAGSRP